MKHQLFRLALLTALALLFTACGGIDSSNNDTSSSSDAAAFVLPADLSDEAAMVAAAPLLPYYLNQAHRDAIVYSTTAPWSLPPFIQHFFEPLGIDLANAFFGTCSNSPAHYDSDLDGVNHTTYQLNCTGTYGNFGFILAGDYAEGDANDSDSNVTTQYAASFTGVTFQFVDLATYQEGNPVYRALTLVIDGSIEYDAETGISKPNLTLGVVATEGEQTFYSFTHDLAATTVFAPGSGDTQTTQEITELTAATFDFLLPTSRTVNVSALSTTSSPLVFDSSCAPWGFTGGSFAYLDAAGNTLYEATFNSCAAPSVTSNL